MKKVDMSSEAIIRRLQKASELRDLCISLMKSKPIDDNRAKYLREKSARERLKHS